MISSSITVADYRDAPLKCPACTEAMEERVLSGSTVDTCPKCRGLWVDWFDGELVAVVKETAPLSMRPPLTFDPTLARCPRCTKSLVFEETTYGGVTLLRCGDCAGCFVPREAFTALMELDLPAMSRVDVDVAKQTAFERLIAAIHKLFHAESRRS
jgi:Zn-finger nucleic acid-binding protein